jgi:TolB-like protein
MDPRRWEEIQAAFDKIVELDAASRVSRLAALGATDPALRNALESLLAADAEAEARLAPLDAAFLASAANSPDPFGLAGRTVSHFRVLAPLGAGGMGVVYRAEDTRLGRAVALKFLLPQYSLDASAKARFLREAHSAAALDHTNLCTIHEVGESEDGRLFLAMALYPGETLKARLAREGPLPVGEALEIARQVGQGLACAHAAGIVHRDLKPGNVMLLPDGTVKILDFGLAKARDWSLSGPSARLGTVSYMAPEQIRGEAVDGRTDLWALGVVLYEMLTGRKPFAGEHEFSIAHAILHDEPVRPSTLRAEIPPAVQVALLTLLEKHPARRYATAAGFLDTLTASVPRGERPIRLLRSPGLGVSWPLSRRRSLRGAVGGGIVIAVAAAALLVSRNGGEDDRVASRVVVMPFENRSADRDLDALGTMAADWVAQGLTEAGFLTVLDTRSALAAAHALGSAAAPVAVGRETGAGVVVVGSYFLQSDSLQFQAQIASTADGNILFGIGGITVPRARPLDGVEQLRQRVLAALASLHDKEVTTFQTGLARPPTYAAYREYTEGLELYLRTAWRDAARHFQRAAALDSSFLVARLWAAQSWDGVDNAQAKSILHGLQPLRHRLGGFDRARFDFVMAQDPEEAYRAALRMVEATPGSVDARREAALSAMRVLRGREALKRLRELDPERGLMRHWGDYWSAVAWTQHMLGEHQDELAAARRGRQLYPSNGHFRFLELRALAALGRAAELDSVVRAAWPATPGQIGILSQAIAGELLAHGHAGSASRLVHYAAELLAARPPSEPASAEWLQQQVHLTALLGDSEGWYYSLLTRLEAGSTSPWERARDEWLHQRAELALLLGDAEAAGNFVAQLRDSDAHPLLIARVAGAQGRREVARAALERAERRFLDNWESLRGFALRRASVLVEMGDLDGALDILAEGLGRGLIRDSRWGNDGHALPDLAPLWPHPRFRALIKPRG